MPSESGNIVIVGAGIAGLYCAWRLLEAGYPPDRLEIYDANHCHGGRIHTVSWPGKTSVRQDLGAQFINVEHRIALGLVDRFGLPTTAAVTGRKESILHLRGATRSEREIKRRFFRKPFPYDADWRWQRHSARRMLEKALRRYKLPDDCRNGAPTYSKEFDRLPLDATLREVLTSEELRYLSDRIGYSFVEAPVNARTTVSWLWKEMFGGRFLVLTGGMSSLVDSLVASLAECGTKVCTGHRLRRLEAGQDGAPSILHFDVNGREARTVQTEQVILAMPPRAIEHVEGVADRAPIQELLRSVMGWPLVTAAVVYSEQWWRESGLKIGRTISDLPIGQLLFPATDIQPAKSNCPGVLKVYAEGERSGYWREFPGETKAGHWLGPHDPLVADIARQIGRVFEPRLGRKIPKPVDVFLQDWQAFPSGAGFHVWSFGSDPGKAMETALRPLPGCALHICGEAWSLRQGWIEGALETTDILLERHFGLRPRG